MDVLCTNVTFELSLKMFYGLVFIDLRLNFPKMTFVKQLFQSEISPTSSKSVDVKVRSVVAKVRRRFTQKWKIVGSMSLFCVRTSYSAHLRNLQKLFLVVGVILTPYFRRPLPPLIRLLIT